MDRCNSSEELAKMLTRLDGQTIPDIIRRKSQTHPGKVAISFQSQMVTYSQMEKDTNRLANSLKKQLGIKKGSKIGIFASNSIEWVNSYFAIQKASGVVVTLNNRYTDNELKYALNLADVEALFLDQDLAQQIESIKPELVMAKQFIVIGNNIPNGMYSYEELLSMGSEDEVREQVDTKKDPAIFLFTSGTTGRPKAVMLSHFSCRVNIEQMLRVTEFNEDDRHLLMTPLWHCAPSHANMLPLMEAGATIILEKQFELQSAMARIEQAKVTSMLGVPALYALILSSPYLKQYDLSSLRRFIYGSAIMPYELIKQLKDTFPNVKLYNGYGQTENSEAFTLLTDEFALSKPGSVGTPAIGAEVRVVDDEGRDVAPGVVGEIIVRGPMFMLGYYKDEASTNSSVKDGWYYSKDMGKLDEDGFLYIVDRKDDRINRGGEHIYPIEIEEVLYKHPAIQEVGVVGVPDEIMGQAVKVFISYKEGLTITENEVRSHCSKNMVKHKVPKFVEIIPELPKTAAGKIDKKVLRTM